MRIILSICLAALLFPQTANCYEKPKYTSSLVNRDREIYIGEGWVGFTTMTDTIKFEGEQQLSFKIATITPDSITIKRPEVYTEHDIPYKRKTYSAILVQQYEYRRYALKDITTFQYPSKRDIGCMGCPVFMFIPGFNVYLYYELRKRWHPSNYKMSDGWHFEVKEIE